MKQFEISPCKKGLIIIQALCCLLSCNENEKTEESNSDLSKMHLRGKVSTLAETTYLKSDSSGINNRIVLHHSDYRFNREGNIVEHKYFLSDTTKWSRTICRYDNDSRLKEKIAYNDDNNEISRETWEYDNDGNLLMKTSLNNLAGIAYTEAYTYNNEKREIEKILSKARCNENIVSVYYNNGEVKREKRKQYLTCQLIKTLYKLDERGNRIEEIYFKSDDTPGARNVNVYDLNGRKTEERHIRSDGGAGPWYRSSYDESGNMIEICSYNQFDSLFYRVIMNYDDRGRLTERWSETPHSDPEMDAHFAYNEYGDVLEELRDFGMRSSQLFYNYQYDESGNWITRVKEEISPKTGRRYLVSTTERELNYY